MKDFIAILIGVLGVVLFIIMMVMFGNAVSNSTDERIKAETPEKIYVIEYEDHEYLVLRNKGICHKANCKYCEEKDSK